MYEVFSITHFEKVKMSSICHPSSVLLDYLFKTNQGRVNYLTDITPSMLSSLSLFIRIMVDLSLALVYCFLFFLSSFFMLKKKQKR